VASPTITPQDISPLLEGLAIMGTGGGGNPEWGRMILEQDVRMGRQWTLIDPEDLADDATILCGGIMGSVKKLEEIGFATVLDGWETFFPLQEVTNVMSAGDRRRCSPRRAGTARRTSGGSSSGRRTSMHRGSIR
jgi:DUF917 family protein